uniref:Acyl_CoA_thio domain-containing protein n=1 Tax=Strongyloides papillosus TaxID=174720 RepID=A0A0N5BPH1_STREA
MEVTSISNGSDLIDYLSLVQLDTSSFKTKKFLSNKGRASIYGGQLISNSIYAAQKTVSDDFYCHSAHIYFLNAVKVEESITYNVEKVRDSKNFALRKVRCFYNKTLISDCNLSFHKVEEPSICHQGQMPDIPQPEDLKDPIYYKNKFEDFDDKELNTGQSLYFHIAINFYHGHFCERRIYKPKIYFCLDKSTEIPQNYYSWIRCTEKLPNDPLLHRCFLAFISDSGTLDYAQKQHVAMGYIPNFSTSLDHSLYFHTPNINVNEWILFEAVSPKADGGRALTMGKFWSRDGIHLATLMQESLHRSKQTKSKM